MLSRHSDCAGQQSRQSSRLYCSATYGGRQLCPTAQHQARQRAGRYPPIRGQAPLVKTPIPNPAPSRGIAPQWISRSRTARRATGQAERYPPMQPDIRNAITGPGRGWDSLRPEAAAPRIPHSSAARRVAAGRASGQPDAPKPDPHPSLWISLCITLCTAHLTPSRSPSSTDRDTDATAHQW